MRRRRCNRVYATAMYWWHTLKHKYFVFVAGRRLGVPISQLLLHDWSKFFLAPAYGAMYFLPMSCRDDDDFARFNRAWLYHQNHEPHHWEYWIARTAHFMSDNKASNVHRMPERFAREMVADWLAAERSYSGKWPTDPKKWRWFQNNRSLVDLDPRTSVYVDCLLKTWFEGGSFRGCTNE